MADAQLEEVEIFYILAAYMIAELYRMHPANITVVGNDIFDSSDLWDDEERADDVEANANATIRWLHRHGFIEGELEPRPCLTLSLRGLAVAQEVISAAMLKRLTVGDNPGLSIEIEDQEPIRLVFNARADAIKIGRRLIERFAHLQVAA